MNDPAVPTDDPTARFLDGFSRVVAIDLSRLATPGTALVGEEERADSGVAACYWADGHAVIRCDPALVEPLQPLVDDTRTISRDDVGRAFVDAGLAHIADADMRVLPDVGSLPDPGRLPPGYQQRWLQTDDPTHVDLVRAFADRCDPEDVEEAALDELDDFDERAINVVTPSDRPDHLVAYGSACDWDWDDAFCDIGVLVDDGCRKLGLGHFVVRHTVAALLAEGRLPLYRHGHDNLGSAAIATGAGFRPAVTLAFYRAG
jgi:hypothetical protein